MDTCNAFHAIGTKFSNPFEIRDTEFILQFSVKASTDNITCSGAYMKLFTDSHYNPEIDSYSNYVIMFGPDKCGENDKIHFILRLQNPITQEFEEHSLIDPPQAVVNTNTTEYRLVIHPNDRFEIFVDGAPKYFGDLMKDLAPPLSPPREIDDPLDQKPDDWIDDEYVVDETAKKPDDWDESAPQFIPDPEKLTPPEGWLVDEPKFIEDPNAVKPVEWDDDIHGTWEPSQVPNPKCERAPGCGPYEPPLIVNPQFVGEWEPPMYRNPMYRGPWKPRRVKNPGYYEVRDPHNLGVVFGLGFDLWTVDGEIEFMNITITDDLSLVEWPKREQRRKPAEGLKIHGLESRENQTSSFFEYWKTHYRSNPAMTVAILVAVVVLPWIGAFFCVNK